MKGINKAFAALFLLGLLISTVNADTTEEVNNTEGKTEPNADSESYQVTGLTPAPQETWAGYIVVRNETGSKLFYTLHSPQNVGINNSRPLIIWLNGGPGCSSMLGNFGEMGPVIITKFDDVNGGTYAKRDFTWADDNNMLFIDSPIDAGFSKAYGSDAVGDSHQYSVDMQVFLIRFFQKYTWLQNAKLYIFGESYAGHYIPTLVNYLMDNETQSGIHITGVGIGNGAYEFPTQMYAQHALLYSAGLVSTKGRDYVFELISQASVLMQQGDFAGAFQNYRRISNYTKEINVDISQYNFRTYLPGFGVGMTGDFDFDNTFDTWANHAKTKAMLQIPADVKFVTCNNVVSDRFMASMDGLKSMADELNKIIARDVPLMLYQGTDDLTCTTPGVSTFIRKKLKFPAGKDIKKATKQHWKVNRQNAGAVKVAGKFYYVVAYASGHLVPTDQAQNSRDMLKRFMNNEDDWTKTA